METDQSRGPQVLRGLSLLLGLLVVGGGCEADRDPPSGPPGVTAPKDEFSE